MLNETVQTIRFETRIWAVKGKDGVEDLKNKLRRFHDPYLKFKLTEDSLVDIRREVPQAVRDNLLTILSHLKGEYESEIKFREEIDRAIKDVIQPLSESDKQTIKQSIGKRVFRQLGKVSPLEQLELKVQGLEEKIKKVTPPASAQTSR